MICPPAYPLDETHNILIEVFSVCRLCHAINTNGFISVQPMKLSNQHKTSCLISLLPSVFFALSQELAVKGGDDGFQRLRVIIRQAGQIVASEVIGERPGVGNALDKIESGLVFAFFHRRYLIKGEVLEGKGEDARFQSGTWNSDIGLKAGLGLQGKFNGHGGSLCGCFVKCHGRTLHIQHQRDGFHRIGFRRRYLVKSQRC
ncbi:hypothetical protein RINTU1_05790 [Candidatus Regiella insecticola]|uniref:Uncharacterized protein n=1 Tax=Candidatus Regiella insecticola TaxID=138073 RepID=A0A6L2ZLF3_9ENTR|nr:hypothetical protein RINTU1_05790 [Candidatus Regiella insecticola]